MQNQSAVPSEPEISIFELWKIIAGGWFVTAIAIAVGVVLALILGAAIETTYRAETVFVEASGGDALPQATGGLFSDLAVLAGINTGGGGKASPITLMQSRSFAERFIRRNNLLPDLFKDQWDAEKNAWRAGYEEPPIWSGAAELQRRISMQPASAIPGATILSIEWEDPVKAAYLADDLIRMANEVMRERDINDAERSIAYVNERMAETTVVELQRVLFSLLEQEHKTLMLANAREHYAFEILDPAIVPPSPFKPNLPQLLIAGFVAGLMFGVMFVFVRALVRRWRREQGRLTAFP